MRIIVIAQHAPQAQALIDAAYALGAETELIALTEEVGSQVSANRIYTIEIPEGYEFEDAAATVADFLAAQQPDFVFCEPSRRMRLLVGKVSARLGTTAIGEIMSFDFEGHAGHLVFGGAAVRTEKSCTPTTLLMVPDNVLEQRSSEGSRDIEELVFTAPAARPILKKTEPKEKASVDLSAASRVVGIGRGIAEESDMAMVSAFAEAVGAELGCTRPIAEEEKWLPRETYIGVSGVMIAPDVYIAVGLSGQVQHTVGISRAKRIVAINKEKNAPIFKQADLGIVGDLYKIVPALTEALSKG